MAEQGQPAVLRTAMGTYPRTRALKEGQVTSPLLRLDFADIPVISRAFAPMVREGRFDVSEMAIATFLQARAMERPLVLLPVVLAARFQQSALLCRAGSDIRGPADLAGRRIGVRAYSQTTGMWLRGIIAENGGPAPAECRWITFEDAHVSGIADPPWAERAAPGQDMMAMLREGALDAVIVGNDLPDDPGLRTVYADPDAASAAFWQRHRIVPANHVLTVSRDLAEQRPELVAELLRMMRQAASTLPPGAYGPLPASRAEMRPVLELALRYMDQQDMLPRPLTPDEAWDGLPASVE
ncbi:ABC transporter substrate-binding protein [Roseomonas marmotae]|uniref:ABC transporter substrate-binding protein n=1 Tax=Roseomonas marmotae TaxID=2768161 RepID=A0ABS3K6Z5_9PROT|nr:ABC transporter substrate-binding protein [Roseomonas marmotae]MBO1073244.1 ABC transporter substrate-binding protein [Roseomonas marmotae]QTI79132.1 ABC transporter substrate-binding protein [Roseomonas marmotae]